MGDKGWVAGKQGTPCVNGRLRSTIGERLNLEHQDLHHSLFFCIHLFFCIFTVIARTHAYDFHDLSGL